MKSLVLKTEWLAGHLDDQLDDATFAALSIVIEDRHLTRVYDSRSGGQRDAIQIPLYPLAAGIATNWWTLLYEPRKSDEDLAFDLRHRLDVYVRGFVFPPISIWSSGDEALMVETPFDAARLSLSSVELWPPPLESPVMLSRTDVEHNFIDLLQRTLARLDARSIGHEALRRDWSRVLESIADADERAYCITVWSARPRSL